MDDMFMGHAMSMLNVISMYICPVCVYDTSMPYSMSIFVLFLKLGILPGLELANMNQAGLTLIEIFLPLPPK